MAAAQKIKTPLTELFGIKAPIMLAGMNVAAGPDLAAAVTNAGGIGVIGGVGYTPEFLKEQINELKAGLDDKNAPFGVDLLLPQVGGNARKTNYDYTEGKLPELIDIIIESNAKLFVSAVGVPPQWVVDKLHKNKIVVAGIIGHPKHVKNVLKAGADMIIYQGGEGGGHTGDVPLSVLAPRVVDLCKGSKSPLTGKPVITVAAGGIWRGKSLAAALCFGSDGVWVGTRFVASVESGAPKKHKEAVLTSTHETDVRTIIFTGRPLRLRNTPYIQSWEDRPDEIKKLTSQGVIPVYHDLENDDEKGTAEEGARERYLLGKAAAVLDDILPAKQIIDNMVNEAVESLQAGSGLVVSQSKL
ncbi:2-nitropropane dioxygenase [Acaromyces ingoldii]|uniref:2-nitropropane dioxygenase n=1 Tax=Acaromyces ingoldii TaxID=215250 RepID=A0A316YMM5_9BASI|nr:2-nitropropane dioxygenase [Acaromyces ingoldii]PWN88995.1 2-nitropropane dioxygenase [Acaromyces ingoldii]